MKRKSTNFRENAGKILIDLGKLVFGSMFLGGILRGQIPPVLMVAGGFAVTAFFCIVGLWWTSKEKDNSEEISSIKEG